MYYGRIPTDRRDVWHNHVNYYLNCLLDVDRHIGAVLDELEATGQADNTVIIFAADHGEMGGAHHLRQKGSVAFQESVNVPLVIADPRHPGAKRLDAVGSHLDLVPTILAFAGLSEDERRYPTSLPEQKTVDLKNHVTGKVTTEKYDKLVLSPGAAPIRPPLPGIDLPGISQCEPCPMPARSVRSWYSAAPASVPTTQRGSCCRTGSRPGMWLRACCHGRISRVD